MNHFHHQKKKIDHQNQKLRKKVLIFWSIKRERPDPKSIWMRSVCVCVVWPSCYWFKKCHRWYNQLGWFWFLLYDVECWIYYSVERECCCCCCCGEMFANHHPVTKKKFANFKFWFRQKTYRNLWWWWTHKQCQRWMI